MNPRNLKKRTKWAALACASLLLLAGCDKKTEPLPDPPAPGPEQPVDPPAPETGLTAEPDLLSGQVPRVLLDGHPVMNAGNYYDNYKEKQLLALQEDLLPMARQRLEDGNLLGPFEVEEDFAICRNQGNYLSIRRSGRQYTGGNLAAAPGGLLSAVLGGPFARRPGPSGSHSGAGRPSDRTAGGGAAGRFL